MATVRYLDKAYRFLRYFGKISQGVTRAHLKCLKPVGNDYAALNSGTEVVPWTDAEFDEARVRALFLERFEITDVEFTQALSLARSFGMIAANKLIPTAKCSNFIWQIENDKQAVTKQICGDVPSAIMRAAGKLTQAELNTLDELETKTFTL